MLSQLQVEQSMNCFNRFLKIVFTGGEVNVYRCSEKLEQNPWFGHPFFTFFLVPTYEVLLRVKFLFRFAPNHLNLQSLLTISWAVSKHCNFCILRVNAGRSAFSKDVCSLKRSSLHNLWAEHLLAVNQIMITYFPVFIDLLNLPSAYFRRNTKRRIIWFLKVDINIIKSKNEAIFFKTNRYQILPIRQRERLFVLSEARIIHQIELF